MKTSKLKLLTTGSMLTLLIGSPVWADDTEIFFGTSTASSASAPNIMLILDTSGSMDTNVVSTTAYNPATSYTGDCSSSNVYFKSSGSSLPECESDGTVDNDSYDRNRSYRTLSATTFYCSPATDTGGSFATAGYYQGAGIRWTATSVSSISFCDSIIRIFSSSCSFWPMAPKPAATPLLLSFSIIRSTCLTGRKAANTRPVAVL